MRVCIPWNKNTDAASSHNMCCYQGRNVHIMWCSVTNQTHGFAVALQQQTVLMSAFPNQFLYQTAAVLEVGHSKIASNNLVAARF